VTNKVLSGPDFWRTRSLECYLISSPDILFGSKCGSTGSSLGEEKLPSFNRCCHEHSASSKNCCTDGQSASPGCLSSLVDSSAALQFLPDGGSPQLVDYKRIVHASGLPSCHPVLNGTVKETALGELIRASRECGGLF
jgi:hypothetical protein